MSARDLIQAAEGDYDEPEVRVWVHPHRGGHEGDDYYEVFEGDSLQEAIDNAREFIPHHLGAEKRPLIAYDGCEFTVEAYIEYVQENDKDAPLPVKET